MPDDGKGFLNLLKGLRAIIGELPNEDKLIDALFVALVVLAVKLFGRQPLWAQILVFILMIVLAAYISYQLISIRRHLNSQAADSAIGKKTQKTKKRTLGCQGIVIKVSIYSIYFFAGLLLFIPSTTTVGKKPPAGDVFSVDNHYVASGVFGDMGDVAIGVPLFVYDTQGKGPQKVDYDLKGGEPAKFAGVIWLDPANNFGTDPHGGYDLRGFKRVTWKARSMGAPVFLEFFIGGVGSKGAPYADSLPKTTIRRYELTSAWKDFNEPIEGLQPDALKRVVGAFGWTANWANNGVQLDDTGTKPKNAKRLEFEIKDIQYER